MLNLFDMYQYFEGKYIAINFNFRTRIEDPLYSFLCNMHYLDTQYRQSVLKSNFKIIFLIIGTSKEIL